MSPGTGSSRRARALDGARREGAEALLVTHRANVRYLSGFTGSNGWLWLEADRELLLTDGRYREQAAAEVGCELRIASRGLPRALAEAVSAPHAIAFESARLSFAAVEELRDRLPEVDWVATENVVESLRVRKEPEEIEAIREALRLAERVLGSVVEAAEPGVTETALAAAVDHEARLAGASSMAFETIVAGGAHGALPHARPRKAPLPEGVPVVLDMGCVLDGYCSDITRCVVSGRLDPDWRAVIHAVAAAKAAAIETIAPDVPARRVDRAAREVLAGHGLEEAFVHSLGHGVGLEVHERPRLAERSADVLREGMVVTVEPGAYLAGRGGVRLEDMVVVTADGARVLNQLGDEPLLLGGA